MIAMKRGDPLYYSARWRALRKRILARDGYRCTVCRAWVGQPGAARVDHIVRVADNPARTFDPFNLRTLCTVCDAQGHREKGQAKRSPRDERFGAVGHDGVPLDPKHPWNAK
jgi:5-methylcytosine-specific restriction endonuclease McrA